MPVVEEAIEAALADGRAPGTVSVCLGLFAKQCGKPSPESANGSPEHQHHRQRNLQSASDLV
jgi:hypothetical protein